MVESDTLFVGIKDPNETRRSLLESSRSVIESLQNYEKIRILREEKEQETARLNIIIKEIEDSMSKLKATLPKTSLKPLSEEDEIKQEQKMVEEIERVREKTEKKVAKQEHKIHEEIEHAEKYRPSLIKPTYAKTNTTKEIPIEELNQLQKLEAELKAIESKLGNL